MSVERLVQSQNRDGGWPYVRGASWTEPTVYAILALHASGQSDAVRRGVGWLTSLQRRDGGWPPQAGIDESTWVTSLVALLPQELARASLHDQAIRWLLNVTGEESSFLYRAREWLLGNTRTPEMEFPGWPWVPGTAAWVSPTSLAVLALKKEHDRRPDAVLARRIHAGRQFLLVHMCREGGWNHGSVRALGYESRPYPETTGLALAALGGVRSPQMESAVAAAQRFLMDCRSADACNWLRIGLAAHHRLPAGYCPPPGLVCRTLAETSLALLATAAVAGRPVPFG